MVSFQRYAIYVVPEGALGDAGANWLGWDLRRGAAPGHAANAAHDALTATPRKYGFHGTIKPPFRLAPGSETKTVMDDTARIAASLAPVNIGAMQVALLGRFVAIVPSGPVPALAQMAAAFVTGLDSHRAPPTEAELARRRAAGLSPPQEVLLETWGYPYVLEEFRFHLTLTGKLEPSTAPAIRDDLARRFAPELADPVHVPSIGLAGEDADGRFHLIHRYALTGPSPSSAD